MNLFNSDLPVTVMLRSRALAVVKMMDASCPFPLMGHLIDDAPCAAFIAEAGIAYRPEAWRRDGRWLETGAAHPLDIVGEVVAADAAAGTFNVLPYAPAAGLKGAAP